MDVKIGFSGVPYPIVEIEEKDIPKNENQLGTIDKPIEDRVEQEPIHNESRARSMQSDLKLSGKWQQAQLNSQIGVLGNGSSGPQVKDLQNQLNEWRASRGQPPIGADGIFGKETEAAVKDFQKSVGLKQDGLAGPDVKRFMGAAQQLSSDSNYQHLSPEGKGLAVGSMANAKDPAEVQNVKDTVKDMREMERDPTFKMLPEQTQGSLRLTMLQYVAHPVGRMFVSDLAKNSRFQDLNPDQQSQMLATIIKNSDHPEGVGERYPYWMGSLLGTKTMEGPKDDQLTNAVLKTADSVSGDYGKLGLLKEMLNDPQFANADREDQLAMLNGFAGKSGL